MFDKPVYKCELLSITPDIRVNNDKKMRENIENAETEAVTTLFVQKTWNPSYFREIMTSKVIPVYRVITYNTSNVLNGKIELDVPKSPCFIKYDLTLDDDGLVLDEDLTTVTGDEIRDYVFSHDKDKFSDELDNIFANGLEYYNNSKDKGTVSDDKTVKKYLRALKITRDL